MPLDPNIALQFRLPQAETPFQSLGGMLTLRGELMKQDEAQRQLRDRLAFENEVRSLPEEQRTPENLTKIAAKYSPAKDLYHYGQQSMDTQARIAATKEAALARITETHRLNDTRIAEAASRTTDRDVRQQLETARLANNAWYNRARVAASNTNTYYNTGQVPDVGAPPDVTGVLMQLQQRAPATPQGMPQQAPAPPIEGQMPYSDAMQQFGGRPVGSPPLRIETTGQQPILNAPQAPVAAPSPAPAPTQAQPVGQYWSPENGESDVPPSALKPVPGQGVPGVRAATAAMEIPKEVQAQIDAAPSPKEKAKIRAQWTAGLVKAEIDKLQLQQSGLTEEATGVQAWKKLLFDTDMKGLGKLSSQQRAAVTNEAARIGNALGLSPDEQAMLPQDNKVKMKAVGNLTNWGATVARSAEKLDLDLKVALDYAKKLPLTTIQMVNKGILSGMTEFNDPNANAYASALNSVRLEYSRLMAGPTSNAMLPVEAMKRGNELLSRGVDVASLEEVGKQMRRDAENTKTATKNQIDALRSSMNPIARRKSEEETKAQPSLDDLLKKY